MKAMQESCLALNFARFGAGLVNGRPEALRKMTASIRNVNKLCDREDFVEDQEVKRKQEEQLNQQKGNTGSEESKIRPGKTG